MLPQSQQSQVFCKSFNCKVWTYTTLGMSTIGIFLNNLTIAAIPSFLLTILLFPYLQQVWQTDTKSENKSDVNYLSIKTVASESQRGRVAIFIDAENLYFSAKEANVKINYNALLTELSFAASDIVGLYYYTSVSEINISHRQFIDILKNLGYTIIPNQFKEKNRDSAIIVDMMRYQDTFDTAVLVSGDGDFCNPVHYLKQSFHRVEVVSFTRNTHKILREIATKFIDISSLHNVCQKNVGTCH